MEPPATPHETALQSEAERLVRLRRAHPLRYAWTAGRRRTVACAAEWMVVLILLLISAAFAMLAALFAPATTPRYMFAIVAGGFALVVLLRVVHWWRDPARRMSAEDVARQDAEALLRDSPARGSGR